MKSFDHFKTHFIYMFILPTYSIDTSLKQKAAFKVCPILKLSTYQQLPCGKV